MTLRSFLKLVELPTKLASVLPFLLGTVYGAMVFNRFQLLPFLVMLGALLCIDMLTTLLNNWMDFRRARVREGYNYKEHNAIVRDSLSECEVALTFSFLLTGAVILGFGLFLLTDGWILFLGSFCLLVGLSYSWGPLPISHTPYGELVSGVVMGLVIPTIAAMVQLPPSYFFVLRWDEEWLGLHVRWREYLILVLLAWPLILAIGSVMLANNICDKQEDKKNGRRTLPMVIGDWFALRLYFLMAIGIFAAQVLGVWLGIFKSWALLFLIVMPLVLWKAWIFFQLPDKRSTFKHSVENLLIAGIAQILLMVFNFVIKSS